MNRCLLLLCYTLALAPLAGAQAPDPGATPPRTLGRAPAAAEILGQDRLITLDEAVALALENNLGLQVERLDPVIARERVRGAWGNFQPNAIATYDRQHLETPTASAVQSFFGTGGNRTTEDFNNWDGGVAGVLPWGVSYSSVFTMDKVSSDSGFFALDPQHAAGWESLVVVPLLRNLYWSPNDLLVRRTRVEQDISDESFRARLTDTLTAVQSAYWDLAAARALEAAARASVQTANDLLELTRVQYQVGVVSRVAVTEAEAGLAQREFELIRTANDAQAAQDRLLTAVLEPGLGDYTTTRLRTEDPTFVPYEVNAEVALQKARERRPELLRAQLDVENAEIFERYSWNQKLPELNVIGRYANNGLAGRQKIDAGTPQGFRDDPNTPVFDPIPVAQPDLDFPTNRWDATDDFFQGEGNHSWGVTAELTVPIGNDTADARHVESRINLRRAKMALRIQEQDVIVEVRNSVRDLQSAIDGVEAAKRARIASAERLRAEQERLRLGDSTPYLVLEFDEDLRIAESSEIRALQVYRTRIITLERAQGTLLESQGVDVVEERERGVVEEFGPQN
jgi:outer membrane protein TolC